MNDPGPGSSDTAGGAEAVEVNQLESLLKQLHSQIRESGWLETNTANKLEEENPQLIKAWKEAIAGEEESGQASRPSP